MNCAAAALLTIIAFSLNSAVLAEPPLKPRGLKVPAPTTLTAQAMSFTVPQGWSYLQLTGSDPHGNGHSHGTFEFLLSPHEGLIDGGHDGGALLGASFSDEISSAPVSVAAKKARRSKITANGREWEIKEWTEGNPSGRFSLSFWEASLRLSTKVIDLSASGSPAEVEMFRSTLEQIVRSVHE